MDHCNETPSARKVWANVSGACRKSVLCRRFALGVLASLVLGFGLARADGPLTYQLAGGNEDWPDAERQAIIGAMDEAVALYNQHGHFEKTLWANYSPGVPTAQASYSGWIDFGNLANMNTRVALHEVSHTLGVGQHSGWNANRDGNSWTGPHAIRYLRHFDGPNANLSADTQHFWPYGLNQNSEDNATNRMRHIEMVAAMRRDMGIVPVEGGVPVDWQMFHFGEVDPQAAGRDFDGDGVNNLDEYIEFTDPTDPLSFAGAPALFYHWAMNETAAEAAFARLDPSFQPAGSRLLSAPVGALAGPDAVFIKGTDPQEHLPPLYGPPASKGPALALGSTGSFGPASRFARIELGNVAPGSQPSTLSFWLNRAGTDAVAGSGEVQHIVSATDGEGEGWNLHAHNIDSLQGTFDLGLFHHGISDGDTIRVLATGLADDTWYHVAVVRDEGDLLTVYIDGRERFSGTAVSANTAFLGVEGGHDTGASTVAYWRFEEGRAGAAVLPQQDNILDVSGNGNDLRTWGESTAPVYVSETPFASVPQSGDANVLALDFSGGSRDLYSQAQPVNTFPFSEFTLEASFNVDAPNSFQVIVGKDGNPIGGQPPFSLKVRNDGYLEVAIADGGGSRRQLLSRKALLGGVWYSAAATIAPTEMALWLKGPGDNDYVLQNTMPVNGLFTPADNSWIIGRGMWNGAQTDRFNGLIDEVRISNAAFGGNMIFLGHDAGLDPSHSFIGLFDDVRVYDGPLSSHVIRALIGADSLPPTDLRGRVNSFGETELTWAAVAGATGYQIGRADVSGGLYEEMGTVDVPEFLDTDTEWGGTYFYVVTTVTEFGVSGESDEESVTVGRTPRAYLPFDGSGGTNAPDVTGNGWNGGLQNGAGWGGGQIDGGVVLDGVNQFVSFPQGVVNGLYDFTIATWVRLNTVSTWSRVFDFGSGTDVNMFLTPRAGGSEAVRFAIKANGVDGEQRIDGSAALPTGRWTHLAVTLQGRKGTLYVNGVVVGTNESMTVRPVDLGETSQNWIGRSQWPDPYLDGTVDEFRVFRGALTRDELVALIQMGTLPPVPPSGVEATETAIGTVLLNWQPSPNAISYSIWRATHREGPYLLLADEIADHSFTDETVSNGQSYHYSVSAVNMAGTGNKSSKTRLETVPSEIGGEERRAPRIDRLDGQIVLTIQTIAGRTYQLQRRADLIAGGWEDVGISVNGTGSEHEYVDAGYDPEAPRMFYRVQITP